MDVEIARGVSITFCWIPAGAAQLGSTAAEREEAFKNVKADAERLRLATETEEKRGKYKTTGFWLAKFAVTQAEWTAAMGKNPSHFVPGQEVVKKAGITDTSRFPVESISYEDCRQLLEKLNASRASGSLHTKNSLHVIPE